MDPTQENLDAWQALGGVIEWAKLAGDHADENTETGSFLKLLGAAMTDPIMLVGSMHAKDFEAILTQWNPNGSAPSPTQRSRAALVGRGSRIFCGNQLTVVAQRAEDETNRQLETLRLQAQIAQSATAKAAAPPPLTQTTLPVQIQKKVKMNLVADQVIEQEVDLLTEEQVNKFYQNYFDIFGGLPPPEEEITVEQLTALYVLVQSGSPPYVDFAVFGPHGYRLLRKMKCTGLQLMPGGDMRHVELPGPPTFGMWERCYKCLKTGLLQLKAVGIAKLLRYFEMQKMYHERYGPQIWHMQYQSEVRCRQERMIHIKRLGQDDYRRCQNAGTTSDYDPAKPWDYVWGMACDDFAWWRREFEEPVLLVLTRTQSLSSMIDGDVDIGEEPPAKRQKTKAGGARQVQQSGWETGFGSSQLPTKHNKMERVHNVSNGRFSTNRRGSSICPGFNAGTCNSADRSGRCSKDPSMMHQCDRCLSIEHPGKDCNKSPGAPPAAQPQWKAKGAGKHKGGGKGKSFKGKGKYYG